MNNETHRTAHTYFDKNGHGINGRKIVHGGESMESHGVSATDKDGSWRTRNNNKPLKVTRTQHA